MQQIKIMKKIKGKDLIKIGFPEGKAIGLAVMVIEQQFAGRPTHDVTAIMTKLVQYPESFLDDMVLAPVAQALLEQSMPVADAQIPLKEAGDPYTVYGAEYIEPGAMQQMDVAMKLPVTVAGALMPDAHQGYGLPIGGVLATRNAIIPYGVGVDIGCRMALSVYDISDQYFLDHQASYKRELIAWTKFGAGASWQFPLKADHNVLDRAEFNATRFIKGLHDKAAAQLGTSGGGNHFVEFGIIEFAAGDTELDMPPGKYLALLTHSGSRGFGATVAGYYTNLAKEKCILPKEAVNLAYLDMDSAEGQEYWMAMNLAGDYASACHEVIHQRLTKAIGGQVLVKVENHHNFAWKENLHGEEVIVHRKGATPASKGVMGIIPGSMTAPGYLVRGKGEALSIHSASHGAGRQMSRTQAIKNIKREDMRKMLKDHGVTLIGAGLDEAPMAYKNIDMVMSAQTGLVDVLAKFTPKLVRMADDGSRED